MIRSFLFGILFWPVFVMHLTIMYPFSWVFSPKTNFSLVFRPLTKFLLFTLKWVVGIDYRIINFEEVEKNLKNGPIVICCNHQSAWETFIFSILFEHISIVVKKELQSKPIAGAYFKRLGCLPVDRKSPIKSIKSLLLYGKKSIENGISVLIFPNGTRASVEDNIEYKSGVLALYQSLKVPVVPAFVDSGKCWPAHSLKKHKGTITLIFKKAIYPGLDKNEFMKKVVDNS